MFAGNWPESSFSLVETLGQRGGTRDLGRCDKNDRQGRNLP